MMPSLSSTFDRVRTALSQPIVRVREDRSGGIVADIYKDRVVLALTTSSFHSFRFEIAFGVRI